VFSGQALTNSVVAQWTGIDGPSSQERNGTDGIGGLNDYITSTASTKITAQAAILVSEKTVTRLITEPSGGVTELSGQTANPGDRLRYTIEINNTNDIPLSNFSLVDELDRLNIERYGAALFQPDSIGNVIVPDEANYVINQGTLTINNLNIDPYETLTVSFEILLKPVITDGTIVQNQAQLELSGIVFGRTDDPSLAGGADPTETTINSAPFFKVQKTSTILSGDPNVLMAGDTLRYTLTIRNIGTEDAVDVRLRDNTPASTTYVANSVTLNGLPVSDTSTGVNPLHSGILVNSAENTASGYLQADATPGSTHTAVVTFDVVVDPNAMNGLVIENQGFLSGSGAGSGLHPEQPSDDPATPVPDDPTRNVVGNLPLLYGHKTVQIHQDFGSPGIVDPGDILRYTIDISNTGAIPATGVTLTDAVPPNTVYNTDSLRLNGASPSPDGGVFPLASGLVVQSSDNPGSGIVSAGQSAVVTFEVSVNAGVPTGTIISNQGRLVSKELPPDVTDADGLPSNGYQPTVVIVGDAQLIAVTKEVAVVGGGVVTDDLHPPLGDQLAYIDGSGTLNGAAVGVTYANSRLTADYSAQYGDLPSGSSAVVRFRVQIDASLAVGTTITNAAVASWNNPVQTVSASVSLDVGGTPGSSALSGNVWHDANLDKNCDQTTETMLEGWSVELYRNGQRITTVLTDATGAYRLGGLVPNAGTAEFYEIRFVAAGAGVNTASLGMADSPFANGPQRISSITVAPGSNLQGLDLPIWPNGAVYNSVVRVPVAGVRLALVNAETGNPLPSQCFDDPHQQNQITAQHGFYKFDLNFRDGACPAGGTYLIEVTPAATGYMPMPSQVIPPASDATTAAFSVPTCPGSASDALLGTTDYCEATIHSTIPPVSVPPGTAETAYHLHLVLSDGNIPGHSQIFNNSIPIDPELGGAVAITKTSSAAYVTIAELVPYTITVSNVYGAPLYETSIVDVLPPGFKYITGSARLDGQPVEPVLNGREAIWGDLDLQVNQKRTLQFLLVVGSGVSEGQYVNQAQVINNATGAAVSGVATATVEVVPDPDFDCTDFIGKVFDDRNLNGRQDNDEKGLAGVRVATVRGLIATTDEYGRFHITCAAVPDENRGSNVILKLDDRSLPTGYRLTTENPRVQRATRGKALRFNFGATIHRVVRIDISEGVFEPQSSTMRPQWKPRIDQLVEELKRAPSVLYLSYLADVESKTLVRKRLNALKKTITRRWKQSDGTYRLTVETDIFWRRGAPVSSRQ
ncbi:MAG: hypothetical protein P8Y74_06245, partial [Desulfobacterales bacterium]